MIEQQLSSHPELGALQKTYRDQEMWIGLIVTILITIAALITILWSSLSNIEYLVFLIPVVIVFVLIFIWVLYMDKRAICITIYKNGFIYQKQHNQKVIFWSEIRYIRCKVSINLSANDASGPRYTYSFYNMNGGALLALSFDGAWQKQLQAAIKVIEQATTAILSPPVLEAYQQGEDCQFGSLTLSLQGISYKENMLLWNEIQTFDFGIDVIKIKRPGDRFLKKWASIPLGDLYNLDVVKKLVEVAASTHHFQMTTYPHKHTKQTTETR
jgi:hypothetical protein